MLDIIALAQSFPGAIAIAVNVSIVVGWKVAGFVGMLVSVLGTILPPMIIIAVVSAIYNLICDNLYVSFLLKGMQCAVAAIILSVSIDLALNVFKEKSVLYDLIMLLALVFAFVFKVNVVILILGALVLGIIMFLLSRRKGEK